MIIYKFQNKVSELANINNIKCNENNFLFKIFFFSGNFYFLVKDKLKILKGKKNRGGQRYVIAGLKISKKKIEMFNKLIGC